jgi:hypothetical protein
MDSTTHKGTHFTEIQKRKIKNSIHGKEQVRTHKVKRYLVYTITPITLAVAAFLITFELTESPSNPDPSQGGIDSIMVEEDWEPRNQFIKEGKVLLAILPDPSLHAKKSFGYIFNFLEPFETYNGKTMAIYATHKDTGLQITIHPPEKITEPSPGYDSLERFTFFASAPLSGYWKFKVVLDGEVYGDVILYIPEKREGQNQDDLLDSNLELIDFDFKEVVVELKNKGIEHKLPSKLPVKITGYEIVEGNPHNPYAPKDITIHLNGEDGVLFTLTSGTTDPDIFFSDNGSINQEEINIKGNKGLYMEGVIIKWMEGDMAYLFTSNERLSKETMIKIAESFQ